MSESYVKPTLWEYVLIVHPRDRSRKSYTLSAPVQVLASSERVAGQLAARAIPENIDIEEVDIAIRPF